MDYNYQLSGFILKLTCSGNHILILLSDSLIGTFSLSLTADDVGCDLPVTEPVSFHGPITFSATEASLLLDPEYEMLYLQNSDTTSALDFLGAN